MNVVSVGCRSGEDHRSLTNVLQDLQVQLKGQEPKLQPGQTQSRPLHVILQVTVFPLMCCQAAHVQKDSSRQAFLSATQDLKFAGEGS